MRALHTLVLATAATLLIPQAGDAEAKKPSKSRSNKNKKRSKSKAPKKKNPTKKKSTPKSASAVSIKGIAAKLTQDTVEDLVAKLDRDDLRVKGEVTRKRGRLTLTLVFLSESGDELDTKSFTGKNDRILSRIVKRQLPKVLNSLSSSTSSKDELSSASDADSDEDASSTSNASEEDDSEEVASSSASDSSVGKRANAKKAPGAATWSVAIGPELVGRSFTYRDDLFGELREYELAGAFAVGMSADFYLMPALGIAGSLTLAPGFTTDGPLETEFASSMSSFAIGARYRRALSSGWLLAAVDYGQRSFSVGSNEAMTSSGIPDVDYKFLRVGAHASWPIVDMLSIHGSFGYRMILETGEIASNGYFPHASAQGIDGELALGSTIAGLQVRAGVAVERYGYALKPEPGDANVAGGAIDQYQRYFLTIGYSR